MPQCLNGARDRGNLWCDRTRHLPQRRKRLLCPAHKNTRAAGGDDGRGVAAFGDRRGMAERGGRYTLGPKGFCRGVIISGRFWVIAEGSDRELPLQ
jgi:hypothetical protein